jgi:hypothetical protein
MPITLICPNLRCRSLLQVPEQVRGQKVRCSRCGRNFIVPPPANKPSVAQAAGTVAEGDKPAK